MTGAAAVGGETVASRMLDTLVAAGARVWGLPGVHNLAFWRSGEAAGAPGATGDAPRIVSVRHEQTAVYAADGFARATGCLGAALVTTGPGAANAVAAFGEAAASGSPIVLVASEVPGHLVEAGVRGALHQSRDQAGMFRPLAKLVRTPRRPEDALAAIAEAVDVARRPPQGPVYVDVPADVLSAPAPPAAPIPAPDSLGAPVAVGDPGDPAALERAVAAIDGAPAVALWAGGGAVQAGAGAVIAALAMRLGAPVFTTFAGRGILPPAHPALVRVPPHEPEVEALLARADLLVVLGSDCDAMNTKNHTLSLPDRVVGVNVDPRRCAVPGRETHPLVGDARAVAEALVGRVRPRTGGLLAEVAAVCARARDRLAADPRTAAATALVRAVEGAVGPPGAPGGPAVVVADMAVAGYWLAGYLVPAGPRLLQYPVGWGTLGYALPAAVGAAAAGRPVLAVCGDGGLAMAVGELATIAQEALPVTVLVVDDGGYGMLRFDQRSGPGRPQGTELAGPDHLLLAAAFGIEAVSVEGTGAALAAALEAALAAGAPRLVHCRAALYPPRTTSPRWRE